MSSSGNPVSIATMIALYNFDAESEPEMSMKVNDYIEVLDMDPALNGWAYARRTRDGVEGYVPISHLGTSNNNNQQQNQNNARAHKHSKSGNQSRSTSPNPGKRGYGNDDKNQYGRNKYNNSSSQNRGNYNQNNQNSYNSQNDNNNNNNKGGYGINKNDANNNLNDNNSLNNNSSNNNSNSQLLNDQHQQQLNNNNSNSSNNNNKSSSSSSSSQSQSGSNNNSSSGLDTRQIICSFHRDFIPDMNDLYKYFGEFGKVTNKIEIEYDSKKVPLAKIKFQSASCVDKVCDKGNRQQIPSGQQNGTIHIRVYRSMQDYISNTQRPRGPYKHKNSRRGGF